MLKNRCLLQQIDDLRNLMIETAMDLGINHKNTITISQELDDLLVKYQQRLFVN